MAGFSNNICSVSLGEKPIDSLEKSVTHRLWLVRGISWIIPKWGITLWCHHGWNIFVGNQKDDIHSESLIIYGSTAKPLDDIFKTGTKKINMKWLAIKVP
jgi:hypothetical protein